MGSDIAAFPAPRHDRRAPRVRRRRHPALLGDRPRRARRPPQLTAHHLAGEFGYADAGPVGGTFTATGPFPVRIDLDALG